MNGIDDDGMIRFDMLRYDIDDGVNMGYDLRALESWWDGRCVFCIIPPFTLLFSALLFNGLWGLNSFFFFFFPFFLSFSLLCVLCVCAVYNNGMMRKGCLWVRFLGSKSRGWGV